MKANQKSKKQEELEKENKKPPVPKEKNQEEPEINQIDEDENEDEDNLDKYANVETNDHDHNDNENFVNTENAYVKYDDDSITKSPMKKSQLSPKKQIQISSEKQCEEYLKEKLKNNTNKKILSSVSKSLNKTLKNIEDDFKSGNLLITEVNKDFSKLIPKNKETNRCQTENDNYNSLSRLHLINELKKKEEYFQHKLMRLEESIKYLDKGCYFGMDENLPITSKNYLAVNENIRASNLNSKKHEINDIKLSLAYIKNKINILVQEEKNKNFGQERENILKKFEENFEKDKEQFALKVKKYESDRKRRDIKRESDFKNLIDKENEMVESPSEIFKKEEEKKLQKYKSLREKQIEIEKKRSEDTKEKISKVTSFAKEKPETKKEDYLYNKKMDKFTKKINLELEKSNQQRKDLMKPIGMEELDEFKNKINDIAKTKKEENEQKHKELIDSWKENKSTLPEYHFPSLDPDNNELLLNNNISYTDKKIKLTVQKEKIKTYAGTIKIPKIDLNLKRQRLEAIKNLCTANQINSTRNSSEIEKKEAIDPKGKNKNNVDNDKQKMHKDMVCERKKRVILKKTNQENINNKYKWDLKLNFMDCYEARNEIKKPKPLNYSTSYEKRKKNRVVIQAKKIDYLEEEIRRKRMETVDNLNTQKSYICDNNNKWEKLIQNNKNSVQENVDNLKNKLDKMENEAFESEKFLKLNGGMENYPKIGTKVSSLLIDSIKAKLSILDQVGKKNDNKK